MQLKASFLALAAIAVVSSGCSTTSSVAQYKSSTENVITIQDYIGKSNVQVKLAEFTSGQDVSDSMWCRANGPISVGSGKTPAQFVRAALQEELFLARAYSNNATTLISGRLDELKFSSVSPAYWEIALTLSSSTGASYHTRARYEFATSWDAINACRNVADAFTPAVQETLRKVISDARFKSLMGEQSNAELSSLR